MRILQRCLIMALVAVLFAGSAFAQKKGRKLPESAYIKTAKIEIVSGDTTRYKTAVAMLDSLFLNYGPHGEGMYWQCKILVDQLDKARSFEDKRTVATKLVRDIDSLGWICGNESIKKDYRKGCDNFLKDLDTTRESIWRDFYNAGVAQIDEVKKVADEMDAASDSTAKAFYQQRLPMLTDSCIQNMGLAIIVDPTDARSYVGLGSVYENQKKYDSAIVWMKRGVEYVKDKSSVLSRIAYNYIWANDYCGAIPYFEQYIGMSKKDTGIVATMNNLTICYNNCKQFDSALSLERQVLQIDPVNTEALTGIGRYFSTQARIANDSVNAADDRKDDKAKKTWSDDRNAKFDSAKTYLRQVFDLKDKWLASKSDPNHDDSINVATAAEEYALIGAVRQDFAGAIAGFKRSTELDPSIADNWTSLGDCYLNQKQFKDAISAYEQVVKLKPNDKEIWQRLADLYHQENMADKQAEAQKKLKDL